MSDDSNSPKGTGHGRDKFQRVRPMLLVLSRYVTGLSPRRRTKLFESLHNMSGLKGVGMRYILLKSLARECGDNVAVYQGAYLFNVSNISFGNNVSIHPMCYLDGGGGSASIVIGNNVSLAHGVTVMATTHTYESNDVPIKYQEVVEKNTVIGDNVWIGAKATVVAGVTVAEGCVIGANSVVTKTTVKNGVYAGAPARLIKLRTEK